MTEPNQDKQAVKQTRDILNARLGEMITGLLGDDSLEKKYAAGPVDGAAGAAAEKSGIVSPDTKTALLIAQAAERTLRAAEKTAFFHAHRDEISADIKQQVADQQAAHAEKFKTAAADTTENKQTFIQRIFGLHAAKTGLSQEERYTLEREQRQIEHKAYEQRETELGYVSPNDNTFRYVGAAGDARVDQHRDDVRGRGADGEREDAALSERHVAPRAHPVWLTGGPAGAAVGGLEDPAGATRGEVRGVRVVGGDRDCG
ncbi:MAG: hypothetical protein H3C49_05910, partial [Alphaproteobacteria bacterium]|nr:hypothetical protein [Alphaproteobacteria bacterium]